MTTPYLLIPVLIILLILYGISLLFSQLEVYNRLTHRKIWNYSLLVTFLTTGILGILMAIQINYKIEVPWTEKVLKVHVNFGIAMTIIAFFHLLWHLRYYLPFKAFSGKSPRPGTRIQKQVNIPGFLLPFTVGFTGVAFQTLVIRELLGLFSGNEFILSIIFFLWLTLTGAGAFAGTRTNTPAEGTRLSKKTIYLILALASMPVALIPLLYFLKSLFFSPGIEAGPAGLSGFLFLILLPFCFLNGFSFTYSVKLLRPSGMTAGGVYAWESVGSASSGFLMTLAILLGIFSGYPGRWAERLIHPNEEIIQTYSGVSGRLTVTRTGEQVNIYENGVLTHSSGNPLTNEELVHFTLCSHPDPRDILVIGGTCTGITAELMKYDCHRVDCIEPDPQVIRTAKKLNLLAEGYPNINYLRINPFHHLISDTATYDVVIVMLAGPQNLNLNRYYASSFFALARKHLGHSGMVTVMLPGTANYVSGNALDMLGPIYSAARKSFGQVALLPGENNYLMASDEKWTIDILHTLQERKIQTTFIRPGYFDENLLIARKSEMEQLLNQVFTANEEFRPKAFLGMINWWIGQFPLRLLWIFGAAALFIILLTLVGSKPESNAMFLLGAGASGLQIILLFLVQITAGTLYLFAGCLPAIFMTGLATGSWCFLRKRVGKILSSDTFIWLLFSFSGLLLLVISEWLAHPSGMTGLKTVLIFLISFIAAFSNGAVFARLASQPGDHANPGRIYAYDLMGAALGAIVFPLALVPLFGIKLAIGVISATGIVSLGLTKLVRKRS